MPTDTTGTASVVTDFDWGLTIPGVNWIWKTPQGSLAEDTAMVIFKERFQAVKAGWGTIQITADNKYRLRLNGREIARDGDWPSIEKYMTYASARAGTCSRFGSGTSRPGPSPGTTRQD